MALLGVEHPCPLGLLVLVPTVRPLALAFTRPLCRELNLRWSPRGIECVHGFLSLRRGRSRIDVPSLRSMTKSHKGCSSYCCPFCTPCTTVVGAPLRCIGFCCRNCVKMPRRVVRIRPGHHRTSNKAYTVVAILALHDELHGRIIQLRNHFLPTPRERPLFVQTKGHPTF